MPYRPTDDDHKLWKYVTKGIKKYHTSHVPPKVAQEIPQKFPAKIIQKIEIHKVSKISISDQEPQLNRRDQERLRKGQFEIDASLDLHGMRQEQALDTLRRFVRVSHENKLRCILIVTGKGSLSSPSVLKQKLPLWLKEPEFCGMVLQVSSAHPKHGGSGAYYVYLKRK